MEYKDKKKEGERMKETPGESAVFGVLIN